MANLAEGGRDTATAVAPLVPPPYKLPSQGGQYALSMVKLLELAGKDTRMGRGQS